MEQGSTVEMKSRNPTVLIRAIPRDWLNEAQWRYRYRRNPTVLLRVIPRFTSDDLEGVCGWGESQSHRTAQGDSKGASSTASESRTASRSQSHRTAQGNSKRHQLRERPGWATRSQSHSTDQGNSELTNATIPQNYLIGRNPTVLIRAIPRTVMVTRSSSCECNVANPPY